MNPALLAPFGRCFMALYTMSYDEVLAKSEAMGFDWNDREFAIIHSKRMLSPCVTGTELDQGVSERGIISLKKGGQLVDYKNEVRIIRTVPG